MLRNAEPSSSSSSSLSYAISLLEARTISRIVHRHINYHVYRAELHTTRYKWIRTLNAIRIHAYMYKYNIYIYIVLNGRKSFQYPEKMDVYLFVNVIYLEFEFFLLFLILIQLLFTIAAFNPQLYLQIREKPYR